MFHRLWTLIRKELQSLLREPQTRAILILPVLIQVILFPFAATLEVTNATIAIYDEDNGEHSVELTQRFARASAFTHVLLLKSPQEIRPTIDITASWWYATGITRISTTNGLWCRR